MIYQLKISLDHMSPPIWRRVQVDSETTFQQLHTFIQIAFNWENAHLYEFSTTNIPEEKHKLIPLELKSNVIQFPNSPPVKLSSAIAQIGDPEFHEDDHFTANRLFFDEQQELLCEWLLKPKDTINYIYDFGDHWEHIIELEKIVPDGEHTHYPLCIKVVHQTPEEDSRGEWLERVWTDNHPEHFWDKHENEMEMDSINEMYAALQDQDTPDK